MLPLHHDPRMLVGCMRFNRVSCMLLLLVSVVALRVELSATRLSAEFGQPALDYHLPTSSSLKSGRRDSNPRSRAPTTMPTMLRTVPDGARRTAAALHPVNQSERADLNPGTAAQRWSSPGPRPGAMPGFATFCRK